MTIINIENPSTAKRRFTSCINKYDKFICLYHWKNCGHCITFKPLWDKITKIHDDKIIVINIELESMKKLDDEFKINGFPSIVIYKNGKKDVEFTQQRNEKELDKFIKNNLYEKNKK